MFSHPPIPAPLHRCLPLAAAALAALLAVACDPPKVGGTVDSGPTGNPQGPGMDAPVGPGPGGGDAAPRPPATFDFAGLPDYKAPPDAGGGACTKVTCTPAGGQYCGEIGDGCGGRQTCGDCPAGQTCGGGGTPKVCGKAVDPNCQKIACVQMGGRLCGRVGDGCGGVLECGGCPNNEMCGAAVANVCGTGGAVCENLCKQQVKCPAGGDTTVTGTVFAPTPPKFGAADPLYNALVYVPNAPVQPFTPGVACEQCGQVSGSPLVTALTGPDGKFTLKNVPVGDNIPLVIQIGRWRRQVKIPKVAMCGNTALPAELTRLPRNKAEGDIPHFAIATGTYDPMDCLLRKIGIEDAEFTLPTGNGRVNMWVYGGNTLGPTTPAGDMLVGSRPTLAKYDMVLLPCDSEDDRPAAMMANLVDYADKGGRIFLTDWSYTWLRDGAMGPFQRTVTWKPTAQTQGQDFVTIVDQTFPKGMAFAQWLTVVMAAGPMPGRLRIHDPYFGASNVDAVIPPTQRWLYTEGTKRSIQHFTFNTPIAAPPAKQCGRLVFSQFHVVEDSGGVFPGLGGATVFPRACDDRPMTPQEKALEFMLFDASACVMPDTEPPRVFQPPPVAPPVPPPIIE